MALRPAITPIESLTHPEVLLWAFKKVKRHYKSAEGLVNLIELSAFELNLEDELRSIAADFRSASYKLRPINLSPVPKEWDQKTQAYVARQYFQVAVRDQVAWAAMATIVGPELDDAMPAWSYGHRLYRPAWFEEDPNAGAKTFNVGPYRHAHGQLYRSFRTSWPLFRRHTLLAARLAAKREILEGELTEGDRRAYQLALLDGHSLPFLSSAFWLGRPKKAYHASIDFEKFYPSVHHDRIAEVINSRSWIRNDELCMAAFRSLLEFNVDTTECPATLAQELGCSKGPFSGIPTGLMVAGLLSNIAMLPVDSWAAEEAKARGIAHLRFVDDHAFIATSFDDLQAWLVLYREKATQIGLKIKSEKTAPPELETYLKRPSAETKQDAESRCEIDVAAPNRLLTATLARVSQLAGDGFELLTEGEQEDRISEIQFLFRADIPESEIRTDTRLSFSAGLLNRIAPHLKRKTLELADLHRAASKLRERIAEESGRRPRAITQLGAKLRREARDLHAQIREKQRESDFRLTSLFERLNGDLTAAVHRYPHKARLWTHLLRFHRITGLRSASRLSSLIDKSCPNPSLKQYVSALLLQVLGLLIIEATAVASNDHASSDRRDSSVNFLLYATNTKQIARLAKWADGLFDHTVLPLFASAMACAVTALRNSDHVHAQTISSKLARNSVFKTLTRRYRGTINTPSIAFWLLDRCGSLGPNYDRALWRVLLDRCVSSNHLSRNLVRLAPPECVDGGHLKDSRIYSPKVPDTIQAGDGGWLLHLRTAIGRRPRAPEPWLALPPRVHRFVPESTMGKTLEHWVRRAWGKRATDQLDLFDPRVSEWSALEVVRQIGSMVDRVSADEIHPANVLLKEAWWDPKPTYATWSEWRDAAKGSVAFLPKVRRLKDARLLAGLGAIAPATETLRVHALAILLLGLLRNSFEWPPRWNLPGQEMTRGSLLLRETLALPISSDTTHLLEGALLPRMIETAFLKQYDKVSLFRASTDDTTYEPKPVTRLSAFIDQIQRSQDALSKGQVAIAGNHLRQLVPIDLMHFAAILGDDDEPTQP